MLWLALYLPNLPLELFAENNSLPFAVCDNQKGQRSITRCNAIAKEQGIYHSQLLTSALLLSPTLTIAARNKEAEQQCLRDLAQWAYQFSDTITFDPSLMLLEIGASQRLFGGLNALLDKLLDGLNNMNHKIQYAVAPTPSAAALLARIKPQSHVLDKSMIEKQVINIALRALTREPKARQLLEDIGLSTIGDCLRLPRAELARRVGAELFTILDRLVGHKSDPRPLWQAPSHFQQRLELSHEVEQSTALVFPAKRLITSLSGYLRGKGAATQTLQWQLEHRDKEATLFSQGLLNAERDSEHLINMFKERIERVRLEAPVIAITLRVDDYLDYVENTQSFIDQSEPQDNLLLEKLYNHLGSKKVHGLCLTSDHRPEKSWRICQPGFASRPVENSARQPLWLFTQAQPLHSENQQPLYKGELRLQSVPQRIESGWWDNGDIARDYFLAINKEGERLWVYHDLRSKEWFLHGRFN